MFDTDVATANRTGNRTTTIATPFEHSAATTVVPGAVARPRRTTRAIGIGLTGVGLVLVLFVAYLFGFTTLQGARAQRRLVAKIHKGAPALLGEVPKPGQPVAILRIPALGVNEAVVEGTSARQLQGGPGLVVGSAYPGTAGNTVIAARRMTFEHPFAHLDRLHVGDRIQVLGAYGAVTYEVTGSHAVKPGETNPASATLTAQLTLVTSNHGLFPDGLLAVSAKLIGKPLAANAALGARPPLGALGLAGDSAATAPALLWTEVLIMAIVLAVFLFKRVRPRKVVYLLGTPVLLTLAVLSFEHVARLLPATL